MSGRRLSEMFVQITSAELSRFVVVGALVALADATLFTTLTLVGVTAALSAVVGRTTGATLAYVLNRRFTFYQASSVPLRTSLLRYWFAFVVVTVVAILLGTVLVQAEPEGVPTDGWLFFGWLFIEISLVGIGFHRAAALGLQDLAQLVLTSAPTRQPSYHAIHNDIPRLRIVAGDHTKGRRLGPTSDKFVFAFTSILTPLVTVGFIHRSLLGLSPRLKELTPVAAASSHHRRARPEHLYGIPALWRAG